MTTLKIEKMGVKRFHYGKEFVNIGTLRRGFKPFERGINTPLIDFYWAVEEFNTRNGTSLRVVRPTVADFLLDFNTSNESLVLQNETPFITDALVGYEMPGKRLGKEIVCQPEGQQRVVLPTGKYEGEENILLAVLGLSSADFYLDGKDILIDVPETRLSVVPDFPLSSGLAWKHNETSVPHNSPDKGNELLRMLSRIEDQAWVGPLVRDWDSNISISVKYGCTDGFGALVEIPDLDMGKLSQLINNQVTRLVVVGGT